MSRSTPLVRELRHFLKGRIEFEFYVRQLGNRRAMVGEPTVSGTRKARSEVLVAVLRAGGYTCTVPGEAGTAGENIVYVEPRE